MTARLVESRILLLLQGIQRDGNAIDQGLKSTFSLQKVIPSKLSWKTSMANTQEHTLHNVWDNIANWQPLTGSPGLVEVREHQCQFAFKFGGWRRENLIALAWEALPQKDLTRRHDLIRLADIWEKILSYHE